MKNFDFNEVGKRTPYIVPNDFFDEMEKNVWKEISKPSSTEKKKKVSYMNVMLRLITSAAAVIAMIVVFNTYPNNKPGDSFADIETSFSKLSNEDQTYLLEIYQDDIFLNE